jgi:hypothetical protein
VPPIHPDCEWRSSSRERFLVLPNPELERLVDAFWIPYCEEFGRLRQQRLHDFNRYLADFLNDLLNYPLVRPWRESLDLFQEHCWQQVGLKLTGESYDRVAAFIERRIADPRCAAHGAIPPESAPAPSRQLPDWITGPAKPRPPGGVPPE